jgi:hypothetical protein
MTWLLQLIPGRYLLMTILGLSILLTIQSLRIGYLKERNTVLEQNYTACVNEKEISYEVGTNYYHRLDDLTREYAAYRLRPQPACIPVEPAACDFQKSTGAVWSATGLRTEWLFDLTHEADELREQMILCQDYLRELMKR